MKKFALLFSCLLIAASLLAADKKPDAEGFITLVDNGQGANDAPDLASPPGVAPGSAFAHCTTGLPRPLFPVDHGNIQIRPSGL